MASIYIETSIVRYLRSRQASHVIAAARQLLTKRWWSDERKTYTLVTSQYVIDEACLGDSVLAPKSGIFISLISRLACGLVIIAYERPCSSRRSVMATLGGSMMSRILMPRYGGRSAQCSPQSHVVRGPYSRSCNSWGFNQQAKARGATRCRCIRSEEHELCLGLIHS